MHIYRYIYICVHTNRLYGGWPSVCALMYIFTILYTCIFHIYVPQDSPDPTFWGLRLYKYISIYIYKCTHIYLNIYIYIWIYINAQFHIYMQQDSPDPPVWGWTSVFVCIYMYTHKCTHVYLNTYMCFWLFVCTRIHLIRYFEHNNLWM